MMNLLGKMVEDMLDRDGGLEEFELCVKGKFFNVFAIKHGVFNGKKMDVIHLLIKERV